MDLFGRSNRAEAFGAQLYHSAATSPWHMQQVLLRIPIRVFDWMPTWLPESIPVFGYGFMLFCAFIACTLLANRLAKREGIASVYIQDLAVWIFASGIIGARIWYMVQYRLPVEQFFQIWNGGLVFYGSFVGGTIGYILAYFLIIRRHGLSLWKIADIIAPCVAIGLCLGRIGCFFNGCCFGNVACTDCPSVHFPLCSPPRYALVERGLQTAAGFTVTSDFRGPVTVAEVEPNSPAVASGLRAGDTIEEVNGQPIKSYDDLWSHLVGTWPRGETRLTLTVTHPHEKRPTELETIRPTTLGLHPTQVYESVSTFLLSLVLLAYFPFRRRYGDVLVLLLLLYPIHRFLNEMLRNDTDPVAFGMTASQNGSIVMLLAGVCLYFWIRGQPALGVRQLSPNG